MEVIDNFIDEESFSRLKETFFHPDSQVPWYYSNYKNFRGDGITQFTHTFYLPHKIVSRQYDLIIPILDKLETKALIRLKANLTMKTPKPFTCNFHTDVTKDYKHSKTAVFYLNTNNGATLFKNKKKVKSVENRIVIFDAQEQHTTITQTDTDTRIVLNLNFYN